MKAPPVAAGHTQSSRPGGRHILRDDGIRESSASGGAPGPRTMGRSPGMAYQGMITCCNGADLHASPSLMLAEGLDGRTARSDACAGDWNARRRDGGRGTQ